MDIIETTTREVHFKDVLDILNMRIMKAKECRELTFNMVTLYHRLKDSHGIADAGMELQAQDRVIAALTEVKNELLQEK